MVLVRFGACRLRTSYFTFLLNPDIHSLALCLILLKSHFPPIKATMHIPNTIKKVLLPVVAATVCSAREIHEAQNNLGFSRSFIQESIYRTPAKYKTANEDITEIPGPTFSTFGDFPDDVQYSGIVTFAHLNATNCFAREADSSFDIGIVGIPFDLGVTYRPGARFGPAGTRMGSRRLAPYMAYRYVSSG